MVLEGDSQAGDMLQTKRGQSELMQYARFCRNTVLLIACLPFPLAHCSARVIQPRGFTSSAIQSAIDSAKLDDIVQLQAGDYIFSKTVILDRRITLSGISRLEGVGAVEPGERNDPPAWNGRPSRCVSRDRDLTLFQVRRSAVRIENLAVQGMTTQTMGTGLGIVVLADDVSITGCEISHFQKGVSFSNAQGGLVQSCYFHRNMRSGFGYGVAVFGRTMAIGGSDVAILDSEFMFNRHGVTCNSPKTRILVEHCYFHDNDDSRQAAIDAHPHGADTLQGAVRDNVFERTRPMAFKSGSFDISGNFFGPGCGQYDVGGYSRMIDLAEPVLGRDIFLPATRLHNIYIGENENQSGKPLVTVDAYNYSGTMKHVAYNTYVNGSLWEALHTEYPPRERGTKPLVGHVYVTLPNRQEPLQKIQPATWYDVHAFACDPQGADDICQIAIQLANADMHAFEMNLSRVGTFDAAGNYFVKAVRSKLRGLEKHGTELSATLPRRYVSDAETKWTPAGSHRIHLRVRFRLHSDAKPGTWKIFAIAGDRKGNQPAPARLERQHGWSIFVEPATDQEE